jgi:hypothetical protein
LRESPRAAAPTMVATGKGKDRNRATTRKLSLMLRESNVPGWVGGTGMTGTGRCEAVGDDHG